MSDREDGSLKAGKEMKKAFDEKGSGKAELESAACGRAGARISGGDESGKQFVWTFIPYIFPPIS